MSVNYILSLFSYHPYNICSIKAHKDSHSLAVCKHAHCKKTLVSITENFNPLTPSDLIVNSPF